MDNKKTLIETLFVTTHYSLFSLRFFSLVSFLLVILMLYSSFEFSKNYPAYEDLQTHSGSVVEGKKGKYSIDFKLSGAEIKFFYLSKGNGMGSVWSAVNQGAVQSDKIMTVKYDQNGEVYDIELNEHSIRSYDTVKAAQEQDQSLVKYLIPAFLLCSIYLYLCAKFTKQYADKRYT